MVVCGCGCGVFGAGGVWPRVGWAEADIMRVNSPGPDGGFAADIGELGVGLPKENTPVAELEIGEPDGGGAAGGWLGLPNICVNSLGCADGRLTGWGGGASGAVTRSAIRWLPAVEGCMGDWKKRVNSPGCSAGGGVAGGTA